MTRRPSPDAGFTGRQMLAMWCLAFSLYALTGTGHPGSPDGTLMFLSARNLLREGSLAVPRFPGTKGSWKEGPDGQAYVKYAPGLVIAHLPMLIVARVARHLPIVSLPSGERPTSLREDEFWVQLTSSWIAAFALVLLAAFVTRLGGSRRDAWVIVLLVAVASPFWFYARADSFETLQALTLLGTCFHLHRARVEADDRWPLVLAGTFAGASILAKTFDIVLIPLFVVFIAASTGGRSAAEKRLRASVRMARFLFPVGIAIMLTAFYNHLRFGSVLDSGYDFAVERFDRPFLPGVAKLVLSPSYGLLPFWPPCLLAVVGFRRQWRRTAAEALLVVGIFIALLFLYAKWWAFSGFGWGPRFLVPAIPLLALLALPIVTARERRSRAFTFACLTAGIAVQMLVATTSHWQQVLYGVYRLADCPADGRCLDDPRVAPLRVAAWRVEGAWLRAVHPERFAAHAARPPWVESYPWREPDRAAEMQLPNTGLDLWAAPERWRLTKFYLWLPGREALIPSSPLLIPLFSIAIAGGLLIVRRAIRERPAIAGSGALALESANLENRREEGPRGA
ncbi:MAG: ArnT family glycosyltransferase [Candidatus Binatia bacterium]